MYPADCIHWIGRGSGTHCELGKRLCMASREKARCVDFSKHKITTDAHDDHHPETKFIITSLKDLPVGDNSLQYRMKANDNYVDFATFDGELCAHTWQCPGQGREFLKALEEYAKNVKLKLTIPTVLNIRLEKILRDNGYTMKEVPYMDDMCELWSKDA